MLNTNYNSTICIFSDSKPKTTKRSLNSKMENQNSDLRKNSKCFFNDIGFCKYGEEYTTKAFVQVCSVTKHASQDTQNFVSIKKDANLMLKRFVLSSMLLMQMMTYNQMLSKTKFNH